jgi:hypothetical protein
MTPSDHGIARRTAPDDAAWRLGAPVQGLEQKARFVEKNNGSLPTSSLF